MRHVAAVLLASILIVFFAPIWGSAEENKSEEKKYSFDYQTNLSFAFDDDVQGQGYFMSYKYERMKNGIYPNDTLRDFNEDLSNGVSSKSFAFGTGSMNSSRSISAYSNRSKSGDYRYALSKVYLYWAMEKAGSGIVLNESVSSSYSPFSIRIGRGYYDKRPINYSLKLSENTWIKNLAAGMLMNNRVDYAEKLNKKIYYKTYQMVCEDRIGNDSNWINEMNTSLAEEIRDGAARIISRKTDGVVIYNRDSFDTVLGMDDRPLLEFDESYIGDFDVEKKMGIGNYGDYYNFTFAEDDDVQGLGYYSKSKDTRLQVDWDDKNYDINNKQASHGSGAISSSSKMGQFRIRNNTSEDNPDWYTVLSLKDNASAYFAPWSISAGTGYYARHPLAFSSKISDETSMKNRVMATSMRQRVSDARSLQKSNEFETLSSWAIPSHSIMNISEDVEEGRARFGVLQGVMYYDKVGEDLEADYYKSALRRSPVEFEEEYRGNFHISSSMNLTTGYDYDYKGLYGGRDYKNDYDYLPCCTLDVVAKMLDANFTKDDDALDDLPCCSGGYYKLSNYYQDLLGESMEGLFNCSCFKIWGNMTG